MDTLVVILGTNYISRAPVTPESRWEPLVVCLLNELKEKHKPSLVVLCTIPQNPEVVTPVAEFMNGNVIRWNEMIRNLIRSNPGELRLMGLENTLRMTDHLALTGDGIRFHTLQGRRWIKDAFQTRILEIGGELRTTDALARTSLTGRGRVRSNEPEPLANCLGTLTSEVGVAAPSAPSSDVRKRLGTVQPPRRQSLESRLGRCNETSSQASMSASNLPTITPAPARNLSATTAPAERVESTSVLLWNRPDPSAWGQYKADMLATLNMKTLPQDLDGLPQDNTMGHLNTRSLTDVRRRARELIPPLRKGKFTTENKSNNEHHKMYQQFSKPPGQLPGNYSREYPRATSVEGDDRRYKGPEIPMGDSLFAAYDPLDIKNAKYLIVASSDYLYTPRSHFWPDEIFPTAPTL